MTAAEKAKAKAKELYNTFYSTNVHPNSVQVRDEIAKEFATKCVNEMIKLYDEINGYGLLLPNSFGFELHEIKQEIEKL